jgi:hypothetical protein
VDEGAGIGAGSRSGVKGGKGCVLRAGEAYRYWREEQVHLTAAQSHSASSRSFLPVPGGELKDCEDGAGVGVDEVDCGGGCCECGVGGCSGKKVVGGQPPPPPHLKIQYRYFLHFTPVILACPYLDLFLAISFLFSFTSRFSFFIILPSGNEARRPPPRTV